MALVLAAGGGGQARAQEVTTPSATVQLQAAPAQPPARVMVMNRTVATLRGSLFGITAESRAVEAKRRIGDALDSNGDLAVSTRDRPEGTMVELDGAMMFALIPGDTLEGTLPAARSEAHRAAALLQQAIEESRESRNLKSLLTALGVSLLATSVAALLLWAAIRLRRRVERWIVGQTLAHADRLRVGGVELCGAKAWCASSRWLLDVVFWSSSLLLTYEWLSVSLAQFPFTRAWGEQLNDFLFGLLGRFALAIVRAVPDLLAAALIFWLALAADAHAARLLRQGRCRPGAPELARRRRRR